MIEGRELKPFLSLYLSKETSHKLESLDLED